MSHQYVAAAGMGSRISFWSAYTGAFKSFTDLQSESPIVKLHFLRHHSLFILVVQANGMIHIAHPTSSRIVQAQCFLTLEGPFVDVNEEEDTIFVVGEGGEAETLKLEQEIDEFILREGGEH